MSAPEPSIQELIEIGSKAINGKLDKTADFVRGSDYESLLGPSAVVWSREAARDTDLFNATNFHTADGDDLTEMARKRFGKERVLDTRGQGVATIRRPAGGIADKVWKGTRISIIGSQPKTYRAIEALDVDSTTVSVPVRIEAVDVGPGVAASVNSGLRLDDALTDPSWVVDSLTCADGTTFEKADVFRNRIRQERLAERVGQSKAIIKACNDAGAKNVAIFRSDYAGDAYDNGLNVCYVGDLGYFGSPGLVKACTLALRKVRVAGDHLQVLPMARAELAISADVYLYASPVLFDIARLERIHNAAIRQYLNGSSGRFAFSLDGIRGAIATHTPEVQRVVLTTPTTDNTVVSGPLKSFPETLDRFVVGNIVLRYQGP